MLLGIARHAGADVEFLAAGVRLSGELGFTTATEGVAIIGGHLLMTFDGGHHWNPLSFG